MGGKRIASRLATAGLVTAGLIAAHAGQPASAQLAPSLSISAAPAAGVWGTTFSIVASVSCGGVPSANVPVQVMRNTRGGFDTIQLALGFTDANGMFQLADRPAASSDYTVVAAAAGACVGGVGSTSVGVRPGVIVNPGLTIGPAGGVARLSGHVLPARPGRVVYLQQLHGPTGLWLWAATARLDRNLAYRFDIRRTTPGSLVFRIGYPTQDFAYLWNVSRNVRVTWEPVLFTIPTPTAISCHPSYLGACLRPDVTDYDCLGGTGDGPFFTGPVQVVGPDVFGLDADGNGLGCE